MLRENWGRAKNKWINASQLPHINAFFSCCNSSKNWGRAKKKWINVSQLPHSNAVFNFVIVFEWPTSHVYFVYIFFMSDQTNAVFVTSDHIVCTLIFLFLSFQVTQNFRRLFSRHISHLHYSPTPPTRKLNLFSVQLGFMFVFIFTSDE